MKDLDFVGKESLGKGTYGWVTVKRYIGDKQSLIPYKNQEVALKELILLRLDPIVTLLQETLATKNLSHPNIIKILGIVIEKNPSPKYGIVMEYCPEGSLFNLIHIVRYH